jgi:uncharacterized damage-inducible protein DinB
MNLQDLRTLVDYHYWARDRLLEAVDGLTHDKFVERIESSFPSMRDTLAHLCGSESVWVARWDGNSPAGFPDPRDLADLAAIRASWLIQEQQLRAVLERLGEQGINRPLEYRGFDGRPQAQLFAHMLQHLVNHGSYHRGQVTTMLRQLGMQAPRQMDLIAFYREGVART